MSDELFAKMAQAIIDGEAEDAAALAQEGLDAGIAPGDILDKGFVKGIEEVGDLFAKGEFFLPELVQGAEAMKAAVAVVEPAQKLHSTEQSSDTSCRRHLDRLIYHLYCVAA